VVGFRGKNKGAITFISHNLRSELAKARPRRVPVTGKAMKERFDRTEAHPAYQTGKSRLARTLLTVAARYREDHVFESPNS